MRVVERSQPPYVGCYRARPPPPVGGRGGEEEQEQEREQEQEEENEKETVRTALLWRGSLAW